MIHLLAFHRSLSSSLSQWLHQAGLNMGHYLMPPAVSNPDGHYEDMPLVDLHDRLLRIQGCDWRFHDERSFDPCLRLDLLERYVQRRAATSAGSWGAKDPRACLFFPAWRKALGEQGRYLVVLRHWSGCVQSLYRRHSEALALGEGNPDIHSSFWRQPELAARMWLAYNQRILSALDENPGQMLVVTQQAVLAGTSVIEAINQRFGLELDETTPSPLRTSLSHDRIDISIRERLPRALREALESMWRRLLAHAERQAEKEEPLWIEADEAEETGVHSLLMQANSFSSGPLAYTEAPQDLQGELKALSEDPWASLDDDYWCERIDKEARFVPECWEFLARAHLNRGQACRAEQLIGQVLLCGKSKPYLFMLLGMCREAELDDEGAEYYYRLAIKRNDDNPGFHIRLANLWLSQGHHSAAEEYMKQLLLRLPGRPPLMQTLANCLDQQGKTQEAIDLLNGLDDPPLGLEQQRVALQIKINHAEGLPDYRRLASIAAARFDVQQSVIKELSSIEDPLARKDLAKRIVGCWQDLGVAVAEPEN